MGYLGGYQGDYLGGYRGDPGLFGFIGRAAKKIGGAIFGATPVGQAVGAARKIIAPQRPVGHFPGGGMQGLGPPARGQMPSMTGAGAQVMGLRRKSRRMNVGNAKALRRAIRRQEGFVKLARRALKGTGYTVVSRGSTRRRPVTVRESGPGSVVVR